MTIGGGLFSRYYLDEGIRQDAAWTEATDAEIAAFATQAARHFQSLRRAASPGEAETESLVIFPVLALLGWHHLPQQKAGKRREDIPDALLFADAATRDAALALPPGMDRWRRASVVNENKAWALPLDRASERAVRTPASQALRYLRLADEHTQGALRWALLTNGRIWRLYYAGASSVADRFLEADLPALLADAGNADGLARLKTFVLFLRRDAFLPDASGRSFLLRAMEQGRAWQERVTADLSRHVFDTVYPELLAALGAADPARNPADPAWPETIRHAAVVLLYRLLFLLYAEDRDLLPVSHPGYQAHSLAHLRRQAAQDIDSGRTLSSTDAFHWAALRTLFHAIDRGSDAMALPQYNGGLFDAAEAPLLRTVELPDAALTRILDGLSRHGEDKRRINYRDLSVRQLGAIYERLLDFDVACNPSGIVAPTADSTARWLSGSFYTPPALVRIILDATIGPELAARRDAFKNHAERLKGDRRPRAERIADLRRFDTAESLMNLRLADPAMGSGHFLVTAIDRLADAVLLSMEEAAVIAQTDGGLEGYVSPLAARIADERARIEGAAQAHGWHYRPEHLDDRHLVRRLVLKRAVYGVDRNPLAVELAKLSLWLHSFTVGAPLSFLDHHLRCGDALFGAWIADTEAATSGAGRARAGGMALHSAIASARGAAVGMARIEDLADANIDQVRESRQTFETVEQATAPLRAFLDCFHALLWLPRLARDAERLRQTAVNAWLDGACGDAVALAGGDSPRGTAAEAVGALLQNLRDIARRQTFLHWQPSFPGVWSGWQAADARGGFDAVIGNPPWVRQESLGAIKAVLKDRYRSYEGKADLSVFFVEQALRLLRPGGRVGFVLPNKFFKAEYGEGLRDLLGSQAWVEKVVDFGHNRDLFPDADVFPSVVVARRPLPAQDSPANASIVVVPGDRVDQDTLAGTVAALSFAMPLRALDRSGWVLEPPEVLALMERLRREHPTLVEYAGVRPQYGVKTGCNEAFVVDTPTRDRLIAADPSSAELLRPFLRGQDIERWAADWAGLWMIFARHGTDIARYPAIEAHLTPFRASLEPRPENWQGTVWPGRKPGTYRWWEIQDSVAYFDVFECPKIVYQEIQFYPAYAVDTSGIFTNNKTFLLADGSPFLLAALNSPLLWWFGWRCLPHMKDEALTPAGFKMETLPIARPSAQQAERAADLADRLAAIHRARQQAQRAMADWLRVQWGLAAPPAALRAPFALSADAFASALRVALPRRRVLTAAEVAAIRHEHAATVAPTAARLREAERLERQLSAVINATYGLTPEEEALLWRTAPPRMPITPSAVPVRNAAE